MLQMDYQLQDLLPDQVEANLNVLGLVTGRHRLFGYACTHWSATNLPGPVDSEEITSRTGLLLGNNGS